VWVLFFKALIVDGGKGLGLYFFIYLFFHVCKFFGSFSLKGGVGGKVACGASFIKNHFLLLTFLIVCKFFVIIFHFEMRKGGGMGLRSINIICIY